MVHSPDLFFFLKTLKRFSLRVWIFCVVPVEQLGDDSWYMVCAACCRMTLVFAIMHLCNVKIKIKEFLLFLSFSFFFSFFLKPGIAKLDGMVNNTSMA